MKNTRRIKKLLSCEGAPSRGKKQIQKGNQPAGHLRAPSPGRSAETRWRPIARSTRRALESEHRGWPGAAHAVAYAPGTLPDAAPAPRAACAVCDAQKSINNSARVTRIHGVSRVRDASATHARRSAFRAAAAATRKLKPVPPPRTAAWATKREASSNRICAGSADGGCFSGVSVAIAA